MIVLLIVGLMLAAFALKYIGFESLQAVKVSTILMGGGFAVLVALLWRMQADRKTTYDALDMLTDNDGRASLEAHITIIMAGLAIWWIVTNTLAGEDVSERMVDILMIFVIYRGVKKGIDAYTSRPSVVLPAQDIQQQVVVQAPEVPAVPVARQVRPVKQTRMSGTQVKTATGKSLPKEA